MITLRLSADQAAIMSAALASYIDQARQNANHALAQAWAHRRDDELRAIYEANSDLAQAMADAAQRIRNQIDAA